MPAPVTLGQLKGNILDLEIGDYIIFKWKNDLNAYEATNDPADGVEIPLTGVKYGSSLNDMFFYMIKVDKGLLVGDRVVYHSASFTALNQAGWIYKKMNVSGVEGVLRAMTGGIAYIDEDGILSIIKDWGFGAYPTINEWDTYVVNGNCNEKIIAGSDEVWHWSEGVATLTSNYPHTSLYNSAGTAIQGGNEYRIIRGKLNGDDTNPTINRVGVFLATGSSINVGFRPVFEYKEV